MCDLYNLARKSAKPAKKLSKRAGLLLQTALILASIGFVSCRQEAPTVGTQPEVAGNSSVGQLVSEADELYKQRADLQKVRLGVALLRQARTADYGNYEVNWKLAKFNYYLGAHTDNEQERETAFREGTEAGKAAVGVAGDRAEGHFWLGANYGGSAEHSTLSGLASVEDIRREMEAVLKIDEGYQSGSAYLALGRLYLRAPRLLGGDNETALDYLEKGLRFGPDNALMRSTLAEAYYALNRYAEARKQIDLLSTITPNPDYVPEYDEAVRDAKKLREKLDGK